MKRRAIRSAGGVTLLEVLIAVTLLSLLTVGMSMALRLGLFTFSHTHTRLMENRRVAGAQRVVEQELEGLMPVVAACMGGGRAGTPTVIFQGQPNSLTMVSTFSLQEAWRGRPQILQMFVAPAEQGSGQRLVVNETPYAGPMFAGSLCMAVVDGGMGVLIPQFAPANAGPDTFVLADHLAYCRFSYLTPPPVRPEDPPLWVSAWAAKGWPLGIRIEMAPLEANGARLQPITVTAPLHIVRDPEKKYDDR